MDGRKRKIIEKLKDKEYRDAFAVEHIDTGIPFQIRALREQKDREWTQKELGVHTGMAQETISRIEDPNYGKLTLKTLKRLASAFDVALMVRFVPFSKLVDWELSLTPASLEAVSFGKDFQSDATGAEIAVSEEVGTTVVDREQTIFMKETSFTNNVISLKEHLARRGTRAYTSQNTVIRRANY